MNKVLICVMAYMLMVSCQAMYSSSSKVIQLTEADFDAKVTKSDEPWFIEFYAPWCGHCKQLAPEWEKTAKALNGIINIGAVDMDAHKSFGSRFSIQGFPTLKFFGYKKSSPIDYNGGREHKAMIDFAFEETQKMANKRIGAKDSSSHSSKKSSSSDGGHESSGGDVVVLTDDNFDDLVIKSTDTWFVKFYAPWCGHCKQLAPVWDELAVSLKGDKIKVGKLDATVHKNIAQRYGVQGYPSLKLFHGGKKTKDDFENYEGGRDLGSLEEFARSKNQDNQEVKFDQLTEQAHFDEFCKIERGACVIAFLPHIYDSSAEQRNEYIGLLKAIAEKNKGKPINFLWAQGGDFYDMEETFGLGSGFPAVISIIHAKNAYNIMRGVYNAKQIEGYVGGLLSGKQSFQKMRKDWPKISKVSKWDGKDKKPTVSEDL